jgi:hypothetical membrane protein
LAVFRWNVAFDVEKNYLSELGSNSTIAFNDISSFLNLGVMPLLRMFEENKRKRGDCAGEVSICSSLSLIGCPCIKTEKGVSRGKASAG